MFSLFQALTRSPEEEDENDHNRQESSSATSDDDAFFTEEQAPTMPKTWKEAHAAYCRSHSTLRASIQQVVNDCCDEGQDLPWELPSRQMVVTDEKDLLAQISPALLESSTPDSSFPTSTRVLQLTKRVANGLLSKFYDDGLEESSDWQQDDDDALVASSARTSKALDFSLPIFYLPSTTLCLQVLQQRILQQTANTKAPVILSKAEWKPWCSSPSKQEDGNITSCPLLSKLSLSDTEWLLQLLVQCGYAKLVEGQSDQVDLIVLRKFSDNRSNKNTKEEETQIAIALWKLRKAQEGLERQLQAWSEQAMECQKKAIEFQRQKQKSLALSQMTKRRLLNERIQTSSQSLMTLEQTQAAIETAKSNKAIVDLLAQSTIVLQVLNASTPIEQIQEVHEDLQSEMDQLSQVQEAMAATTTGVQFDEDELLKELEGLTILDIDVDKTNYGKNTAKPERKETDRDVKNETKSPLAGSGKKENAYSERKKLAISA